eukprot:8002464-Pyramimonas_sp.AAC.1
MRGGAPNNSLTAAHVTCRSSSSCSIGGDSPAIQSTPGAPPPPCIQVVLLPVDALLRAGAGRRSRGSAPRPEAGCPGRA